MKKTSAICMVAAAAASLSLAACGTDPAPAALTAQPFKVYMPDGAPAIAMAELMDSGYYNTEFTVVAASAIRTRVASGDADLAIMPINAAASLYNDGAKITMLSVNTHGNLYFVGAAAEGMGLGDLVGKRVGVIGQGQVPDLTLRMLLGGASLEYSVITDENAVPGKIAIRYGADGPSLLPLLAQGKIDYAFLAEPAATTAVNNFHKAIVMDAQQLWRDTFAGEYPQACLVAKTDIVKNEPEYVKWFVRALSSSDGWAADNPAKAIAAVKAHMESGVESTLPETLPADVIARCNIRTVAAADAKATCTTYFTRLTAMQTELGSSVLSKLPDDGFYYSVAQE